MQMICVTVRVRSHNLLGYDSTFRPKKKRVEVPTVMSVQDVVVKRIDEGLGLVLEVPSEPAVSPGFVHISNVADAKTDKLQQVWVRVASTLCVSWSA